MWTFALRDIIGWGFGLWLIGYLLGFVFYGLVPAAIIGWYVMPIGIAVTCFVLWKWVHPGSVRDGVLLGIGWSVIASSATFSSSSSCSVRLTATTSPTSISII